MAVLLLGEEPAGYGLEQWLEFIGHLHPLVLHVPIGLLVGVVAMEAASWIWAGVVPGRRLLSVLFGLSAAAAALTGWWLGQEADFHPSAVDDHRKFGIAAAVAALLVGGLDAFFRSQRAGVLRVLALLVSCVLFTVAGHRGGMMTHGKTFLSETAPPWLAPYVGPARRERSTQVEEAVPSPSAEGAQEYGEGLTAGAPDPDAPSDIAVVYSAFEQVCVECHCEAKVKGDLRLDRLEGWSSIIDLEDPEFSELLYRVRLPADDVDAMPPEGDRLTPEVIAAIESWIHAGAPMDDLGSLLGESD